MEPEYEDPDAMVSSPSAMSPDELPTQGPDDETSTITIVPPWVSYKKHALDSQVPCSISVAALPPLAYCTFEIGIDY